MQGISDRALQFGKYNRYKYNGIEHDTTFGVDDYETPLRNLDPQTGRWWQIDPQSSDHADDMERWSPYVSNKDNPILYKDPRGDCPNCIVGALIGLAVDYAFQVAQNRLEGKSWSESATDISYTRLAVAGGLGFATSGVSSMYEDAAVSGTTMAISKTGTQAAVVGVSSVLNQTNDAIDKGENVNISPAAAGADMAVDMATGGIVDKIPIFEGVGETSARGMAKTTTGDAVVETASAGLDAAKTQSQGAKTSMGMFQAPDQAHVSDATSVKSPITPVISSSSSTTSTNYVQMNSTPQNNSPIYIYNPSN